jgi:hypothetical protein
LTQALAALQYGRDSLFNEKTIYLADSKNAYMAKNEEIVALSIKILIAT